MPWVGLLYVIVAILGHIIKLLGHCTVEAATLMFISRRGSAISSAQ